MKPNEYQCAHCGEIYKKGWSDEEAEKEATDIFGKPTKEWKDSIAVICDDCFEKMNPKNYPHLVEKAKQII